MHKGHTMKHQKLATIIASLSTISSAIIITSNTHATGVADQINVTIPVACSLTSIVDTAHTATVENSAYENNIGETTFKVFCNDAEGFSVYAVGYTNDEPGNNTLKPTNLASSYAIATGTATSGDTSNWAMKLTAVTGTYAPTIHSTEENSNTYSFTNYHTVPEEYTKVASLASNTDATTGSSFKSTYAVYASPTQPADSYTGKVKYTIVHPNDHSAPATHPATLDTGTIVNSKLKSLAATVVSSEDTTINYNSADSYVKSINVHLKTATPAGFTPSEKNTISSSNSNRPIYIIFDNTNDAGIMHFYTEGDQIVLPANSSYMFYEFYALSDLSALSNWDSSNATSMSYMFNSAGYNATTFTLDLSSWDTSNVTNMSYMFGGTAINATTWSVGDLSSWDTSNVTNMNVMFASVGCNTSTFVLDLHTWDTSSVSNMSGMFGGVGLNATTFTLNLSSWDTSSVVDMSSLFASSGQSATTFTLDLSSWDTSNVTNMNVMFAGAGYNSSTFTLDLSSWDTSNVTSMNGMFNGAGYNATNFTLDLSTWDTSKVSSIYTMFDSTGYNAINWSITIPQTNGNGINNTAGYLYGSTTSNYVTPPNNRSFTLAQS